MSYSEALRPKSEFPLWAIPVQNELLDTSLFTGLRQLSKGICKEQGYTTLAMSELGRRTLEGFHLPQRPAIIYSLMTDSLYTNPKPELLSDRMYPNLEHGIWKNLPVHFFTERPADIRIQSFAWDAQKNEFAYVTKIETDLEAAQWYRAYRALQGQGPWEIPAMLDVTDSEHLTRIAVSRGWKPDDARLFAFLRENSPLFAPMKGTMTVQTIDYRDLKTKKTVLRYDDMA